MSKISHPDGGNASAIRVLRQFEYAFTLFCAGRARLKIVRRLMTHFTIGQALAYRRTGEAARVLWADHAGTAIDARFEAAGKSSD